MDDQLKKTVQQTGSSYLNHRVKLLPTSKLADRQQIVVPLSSLSEELKPYEDVLAFEERLDGLDKQDTLPMMVLKGIANHQNQPTPVMQSEISGAAGNAAAVGIGNIANYIFKYSNNFLLQRGLGIELFGLYSLSMSLITLVSSIFNLGLDNAMVRYIAIYRGKEQTDMLQSLTIFCTVLAGIMGMVGALLVLYFAPLLATLEHKPEIAPILEVLAPLIPLTCMQAIWIGGLQGFKQFKKRVLLQRTVIPTIMSLLLVVVIFCFRSVMNIALVTILGTVISLILNLYFLYPLIAVNAGETKAGVYKLREWLAFATPNFLTSIVTTVLDAVDTLLLGFFAISNVAIGQYVAALKISGFISMPLISLNVMFAPTIAELYSQGEHDRLEAMFKVVTKWTIIFSLPIFCIATLFAVPLLSLSGGRFAPGWPLVIALSVGGLVNVGTGSVGYMLLMTGHQKFSLLNSLSAVIINTAFGVILTPRYGAIGTAISTGLAVCIINLISLLEVRVLIKIQPYRWDTLKPLAAGAVSSLLTGMLLYCLGLIKMPGEVPYIHMHAQPYVQLLLIPVFLAIYIVVIALLKVSPEDKVVLDKLRKKFKRSK